MITKKLASILFIGLFVGHVSAGELRMFIASSSPTEGEFRVPDIGLDVCEKNFARPNLFKGFMPYSERRGLSRGIRLLLTEEGKKVIGGVVNEYAGKDVYLIVSFEKESFQRFGLKEADPLGNMIRCPNYKSSKKLNGLVKGLKKWQSKKYDKVVPDPLMLKRFEGGASLKGCPGAQWSV